MPRHLETVTQCLVTDPMEFMRTLRTFVRERGLVECGRDWREVVRSFADDFAFLDFSARRDGGHRRVLIEFGVCHEGDRRLVGFFDAFWDVDDADFRQIEAISLDGEPAGLEGFCVPLLAYVNLPLAISETAEMAA